MKIGVEIEWRKDCYGREASALYLGGLYVGSIIPGMTKHHPGKWRGWFMSDDDGNETGWFDSPNKARDSVEKALFAAIKFEAA
jgi:hypothetical protein